MKRKHYLRHLPVFRFEKFAISPSFGGLFHFALYDVIKFSTKTKKLVKKINKAKGTERKKKT